MTNKNLISRIRDSIDRKLKLWKSPVYVGEFNGAGIGEKPREIIVYRSKSHYSTPIAEILCPKEEEDSRTSYKCEIYYMTLNPYDYTDRDIFDKTLQNLTDEDLAKGREKILAKRGLDVSLDALKEFRDTAKVYVNRDDYNG
ncbi:hypothetical protein KY333_01120 [Candidatus Woesearchaeota archaeon]|nr:hypothetical protein [Candidatus Woesearchaeota archaeon]MBW2994329.1 hypothetical protein [Candidatus Woesearchaeota archaeon]